MDHSEFKGALLTLLREDAEVRAAVRYLALSAITDALNRLNGGKTYEQIVAEFITRLTANRGRSGASPPSDAAAETPTQP